MGVLFGVLFQIWSSITLHGTSFPSIVRLISILMVSFLDKDCCCKMSLIFCQLSFSISSDSILSSIMVLGRLSLFAALAENFATLTADKQYLSVLLAKCDQTNELFNSDKQLANWTKETISAIEGFKSHQNVKQACTWIRAGGKVSNGFSLFK